MTQGFDVYNCIVNGYTTPTTTSTNTNWKRIYEINAKVMNFILYGLGSLKFVNMIH